MENARRKNKPENSQQDSAKTFKKEMEARFVIVMTNLALRPEVAKKYFFWTVEATTYYFLHFNLKYNIYSKEIFSGTVVKETLQPVSRRMTQLLQILFLLPQIVILTM